MRIEMMLRIVKMLGVSRRIARGDGSARLKAHPSCLCVFVRVNNPVWVRGEAWIWFTRRHEGHEEEGISHPQLPFLLRAFASSREINQAAPRAVKVQVVHAKAQRREGYER